MSFSIGYGHFGFGPEDVKLWAELPQVQQRISPFEDQHRQQYDGSDIGY